MASLTFNEGSYALQTGGVSFSADNIDIILVKSTYTPNKDDTAAVLAAAELGAISGYVPGYGGAGRKVLGTKTVTNDTTNDRTTYDAADPTAWTLGAGETIGGALIVKRGAADDTTATLLFFLEITPAIPTNGSTVTVQFNAGGIGYTQQ